jgi:hypothetical protein
LATAAGRSLVRGALLGEATFGEAEITNLLRQSLLGSSDPARPVRDLQVWFEPDLVYVKLLLRRGVLPGIPSDCAINLAGRLTTADGRLRFTVERVGIGVIPVAPAAARQAINEFLAALLQRQMPRAAAQVELDRGHLTIRLR